MGGFLLLKALTAALAVATSFLLVSATRGAQNDYEKAVAALRAFAPDTDKLISSIEERHRYALANEGGPRRRRP